MAEFFEKSQAQVATVIWEEVAQMNKAIGTVQRYVGAIKGGLANTNACAAVIERDVGEIRQDHDDMSKIVQRLQRDSDRHTAEVQALPASQDEMHRQLEALQKEVMLAIPQAPPQRFWLQAPPRTTSARRVPPRCKSCL